MRSHPDEAARNDVELIEEWERALPPEDETVLSALAAVDRLTELDG